MRGERLKGRERGHLESPELGCATVSLLLFSLFLSFFPLQHYFIWTRIVHDCLCLTSLLGPTSAQA